MRLTDLNPSWIARDDHGRIVGGVVGITFECPVHPGGACYQGVFFANPLDGGPPFQDVDAGKPGVPERKFWQRSGDTFETLTLTPSIHVHDANPDGSRGPTHWHGFITNGEVT